MKKKFTLLIFAILASLGAMASPPQQDEGNVAKVGTTEYATIEEAVAAWGPGKTLTLLDNVTTSSTVTVEVNATKATQNWTLDLGDYTWTTDGCNAFQLYAAGGTVMNQNYGLKIYANQNGGITAAGKYCIECKYDNSKAGYRPRLEIHGGTYNGSYVIYYASLLWNNTSISNGPSTHFSKSNDGTEPVFNGNFAMAKCPITINAGYFNGTSFNTYPVKSTANTNLYGGHFKTINAFPSANNDKGIVYGNYKVLVKADQSIDVVNGAPAEYEAKATKTLLLSNNQSVNYSDYVYYEKANDAILKYLRGDIEIILAEGVTATENKSFGSGTLTIDASAEGAKYTGNITLTGNSAKFVTKFPEGGGHYGVSVSTGQLHVEETIADGIVTRTYSVKNVTDPEAKVGNTGYSTVYDAFYAVDGTTDNKVIVLQKDVTNAGIVTNGTATGGDGKTVATFDLNGKSIGIGSVAAGNNADYTMTIIDSSADKTGRVTNSDASLFILALTGINDYSGSYTLKIQAGTWMFDPSAVVIKGETHNLVDEGYVAKDNGDGTWTVGEIPYIAQYNGTKYRTLQAAFDAAEADNPADIVIDLLDDATLDIKPWSGEGNSLAIGTANTQSITINGNSHKLTFMTTDTDWNNVATMNDDVTKLVLNNMTIDQGGKNTGGTWNAYDINFNCAAELNNVTSNRPLAFKNDATLKNVTVTNSNDVYGVWVQANGQNVSIDGLTVTSGRGLKIDDQYSDNETTATNLTISNATFNTTAKSAILLKSKAGANVEAGENINISNVAKDNKNLVWVDEDKAAEYYKYSLTSTSGATMVPESKESDYVVRLSNPDGKIMGYYKGTDAIANAVAAATADGFTATIFKTGEYTMPNLPHNITIETAEGVEGVVFNHTGTGNIASIPNGATFKGLTFNVGGENYHGFQHAGTINMEGCNINGLLFSYGNMNFTNCEFNQTGGYNMWAYSGDVVYEGCTFKNSSTGRFVNVYNEDGTLKYTVTANNCIFVNEGSANNAAFNVKATCGEKLLTYDVYINNCTAEGTFPEATITQPLVILNDLAQVDKRTTGVDNIRIWKDDVQIYPLASVAKIGEVGYPTLQLAVDAAYKMTGDVTINLVADITEYALVKQKENLNLTIDGKDGEENHKIIGQIFIDGMGRNTGAETLTITNVKFEAGNFYSGTDAFINVPSTKTTGTPWYDKNHNNHAHNITVSNCTFTGAENTNTAVAIRTNSGTDGSTNLTFVNNTAANLHSFAQLTAVAGMSITGNVVSATGSFVNISGGNAGDAVFTGNKFISAKLKNDNYAVRVKGSSAATVSLVDNEFDAPYIVQYGDGSKLTQNLSIESGIYVGDIIFDAADGTTGKIAISGGHFSAPLGDSEYAAFIAEGKSGVNGIYLSETPEAPNGIGDAVATLKTGSKTTNYASLEAAFADAIDGSTITLLKDCAGNGIKVPEGKFHGSNGLIVDFGGHTYTVDGTTVGSAGTETQAFQLLKDNYIFFTNGTIYSEKALFLVQNYSDLTLEDMTLTLNNENYASGYTLSNNNGNIYINGSTINANPAGGFAFDVCRYSSYPSVSVTVAGESVINGDVEVSASGSDAKEGFTLTLDDGKINGNLVLDESAKAAMAATPELAIIRERDSFGQPAPEGYKWQSEGNGNSILVPANYVAQVGDKKYETFPEAATAAAGTKVITLLANIPESYELTSGTLRVEKGAYDVTITAPEGYELVYTISGAVSIYSLTTVADMAAIEEGYYYIKNNGNDKYVNVKGRRTATIDADKNAGAGTIIKVKTNQNGQVQVLRSQAVDIPYYAQRAMTYVPEFVDLLVQKFGAEGSGQILGTQGVDAIMDKFNESFDYHLYVEKAGEGYRIYGRTPSMKPVIEFYQENKANVDAKLPQIESFVNDAIAKVVNKAGMGSSLLNSFKLETIWQQMGGTLTKPTDEASKLQFLQEVLANETNVWNFAYKTVTYYLDQVKDKIQEKIAGTELAGQLPADLNSYFDLVEKIRPGFKYYIVQKDGKFDIVSQGNTDINANAARTIWTLEKAQTMAVNVPEANSRIVGATFDESGKRTGFEKGYYTTLYTDFAYQLPEGAVALKVTEIKDAYLDDEKLTYDKDGITLGLGLLVTEEIGQEVPAQTPVLIMSKTAGDINITIGDNYGASADVAGNILHGADYLISEYEINTPILEGFYDLAKEISASTAENYEHLIRKNSGTVNNKYFFSLNIEDELATAYKKKTGNVMESSPVLTLSKQEDKKLAFNESWDNLQPNAVFLFSEEKMPALFTLTGDVTRDGKINVDDVTGQVNIVQERDKKEYNYDYEAADIIVEDQYNVDVDDVTGEVNIIQKRSKHPDLP